MPRVKNRTQCINCGIELDILNSIYNGTERVSRCRDCYNEYHRNYRTSNKERIGTYKTKDSIKNTNLKCVYGITLEEYKKQKELQLSSCAICKQFFEVLSIDHNHRTNEFRGLLCKKCNIGLGAFDDDEELLLNAIEYLKRTNQDRKVG